MSRRRYSGRRYRRRSPLPALLLVIVLAALVLGALAIFTDTFKKDTPADKSDEPGHNGKTASLLHSAAPSFA